MKKTGYQKGRRKHVVYVESTLKKVAARLKMLSLTVDLDNPEQVRDYIVEQTSWKNTLKEAVCDAYQHYVDVNGLSWSRPVFQRKQRLPSVPSKEQIALVKGEANSRDALIFSLLEEWGLRPIELYETRVRDLDLEKGINNIGTAKWGSLRRTERLKPSTLAMLNVILRILKRREDLVDELLEIEDKLLPSEPYPFMVTEYGWKLGDFHYGRDGARAVKPFAGIGENPGAFIGGLEELLGSGAKGVIKLIGQEMSSEIGLT